MHFYGKFDPLQLFKQYNLAICNGLGARRKNMIFGHNFGRKFVICDPILKIFKNICMPFYGKFDPLQVSKQYNFSICNGLGARRQNMIFGHHFGQKSG